MRLLSVLRVRQLVLRVRSYPGYSAPPLVLVQVTTDVGSTDITTNTITLVTTGM